MQKEGIRRRGRAAEKPFMIMALMLAVAMALALTMTFTAWAVEAGTYTVTMKPSYTDPETGAVEDPGNNEAIGQGMTEKLCGPTGLLEVNAGGETYLTVRYYLSQFVTDVTFEERNGGSYSSLAFQTMQTKAPVEGSTNIDEKYGYTDYRMKIQSTESVFRGKAYIEPMGRSVVYFFTFSNPTAGSGDFITSLNTGVPEQTEQPARQSERELEAVQREEALEADAGEEVRQRSDLVTGYPADGGSAGDGINGSGNVDDPVTGIPQKPRKSAESMTTEIRTEQSLGEETEYHLDTKYDLSQVSLKEARALTRPILEEAVGITGISGDTELADLDAAGAEGSEITTNQMIMLTLLGIAGALLLWFGSAQLRQGRNKKDFRMEDPKGPDEIEKKQGDGRG